MYRVKGKDVDIIEYFDEYILVQEISTGKIFLTVIYSIEEVGKIEEPEEKSNIISIDWARKCQRKTRTKKKKR
jgi:hypothetical protein